MILNKISFPVIQYSYLIKFIKTVEMIRNLLISRSSALICYERLGMLANYILLLVDPSRIYVVHQGSRHFWIQYYTYQVATWNANQIKLFALAFPMIVLG